MKKGIIFDLDGTLWDSSRQVVDSWNEAFVQEGYLREPLTVEDMQGVMGKTMDVIADTFFPKWDKDARLQLLDICGNRENDYLREHGGCLYDGLKACWDELLAMGYELYIVSNCQSGYIEAFLDHYQLWDYITDTECYGNNKKPKADNIALVVERNALTEAYYMGDIQGDYDATMGASSILGRPVTFLHASYGFGRVDADVIAVQKLRDLPQMLVR